MRERQREATLAFLRSHRPIEISWQDGYVIVTWDAGGLLYSIKGRDHAVTPDDLIVQIPAIRSKWEVAEECDRIENSGTDRT